MDDFGRLSHRMANALNYAIESDFYSSNGSTWDANAKNIDFFESSRAYRDLLVRYAQAAENVSSKIEELPEEFKSFILRVEKRLEEDKNKPITRNYKTAIGYSIFNAKTGTRSVKYLDLKTASSEDLSSIIEDVPEARKELMYRAITGYSPDNTGK